MRIIIDGKLYDADNKSIWIHTIEIPPYEAFDPMGNDAVLSEQHAVYRSDSGQVFMLITTTFTGPVGEALSGELLSSSEVRGWLEQNNAPEEAFKAANMDLERG